MTMTWFRAFHGLPFDCKLAVIAKRCGARHGDVVAVWMAVLDYASQQDERGSVEGIDVEQIAIVFDYEIEYVAQIVEGFKHKGMIQRDRVTAWQKRQVLREREDNSTLRVRAYRQREQVEVQPRAVALSNGETPCNANGTPIRPSSQKETPSDSDKESDEIRTRTYTHTRMRVIPRTTDLNGNTSQRFEEFWQTYPRKQHKNAACMQFLSVATTENEAALFDCLRRYVRSSEVARGAVMNPEKWLYEQSLDGWTGEWPAAQAALPDEDRWARAARGL